jgi:hypothetical protein
LPHDRSPSKLFCLHNGDECYQRVARFPCTIRCSMDLSQGEGVQYYEGTNPESRSLISASARGSHARCSPFADRTRMVRMAVPEYPKIVPGTNTRLSGYSGQASLLLLSWARWRVWSRPYKRLRCWSPRASVRRCTSRCVSLPAAFPWSRGQVRRRRRTRPGPGPGRSRK